MALKIPLTCTEFKSVEPLDSNAVSLSNLLQYYLVQLMKGIKSELGHNILTLSNVGSRFAKLELLFSLFFLSLPDRDAIIIELYYNEAKSTFPDSTSPHSSHIWSIVCYHCGVF